MVSSTHCFPSCTYLCLHLDSSKSSNSDIFCQPLFSLFLSLKSAQALLQITGNSVVISINAISLFFASWARDSR